MLQKNKRKNIATDKRGKGRKANPYPQDAASVPVTRISPWLTRTLGTRDRNLGLESGRRRKKKPSIHRGTNRNLDRHSSISLIGSRPLPGFGPSVRPIQASQDDNHETTQPDTRSPPRPEASPRNTQNFTAFIKSRIKPLAQIPPYDKRHSQDAQRRGEREVGMHALEIGTRVLRTTAPPHSNISFQTGRFRQVLGWTELRPRIPTGTQVGDKKVTCLSGQPIRQPHRCQGRGGHQGSGKCGQTVDSTAKHLDRN